MTASLWIVKAKMNEMAISYFNSYKAQPYAMSNLNWTLTATLTKQLILIYDIDILYALQTVELP